MNGVGHRPGSTTAAPGNPEVVLDAVFDFAENLITQQRAFAKHMLRAASPGQQGSATSRGTTGGLPLSNESVRWTCPLPRLKRRGRSRRRNWAADSNSELSTSPAGGRARSGVATASRGRPAKRHAVREFGGRGRSTGPTSR